MATLEEYQRFIVNEPEAQREIRTIEVYHSSFGARRYVNGYEGIALTIEDGAPRSPGSRAYFSPAHLSISDAAERGDSDQLVTITMGVVDGQVNDLISKISGDGFLEEIEVIYRKYYSGDTSQPAINPSYLYLSNISFENGKTATITAEDINLEQKRAGTIYTIEQFPGLA